MSKVSRRKKYVVMVMGLHGVSVNFKEYVIVYPSPHLEKGYSSIVVKRRPLDFKVGDIVVVRRTGEKFRHVAGGAWQIWEVVEDE